MESSPRPACAGPAALSSGDAEDGVERAARTPAHLTSAGSVPARPRPTPDAAAGGADPAGGGAWRMRPAPAAEAPAGGAAASQPQPPAAGAPAAVVPTPTSPCWARSPRTGGWHQGHLLHSEVQLRTRGPTGSRSGSPGGFQRPGRDGSGPGGFVSGCHCSWKHLLSAPALPPTRGALALPLHRWGPQMGGCSL